MKVAPMSPLSVFFAAIPQYELKSLSNWKHLLVFGQNRELEKNIYLKSHPYTFKYEQACILSNICLAECSSLFSSRHFLFQ